MEMRGCDNIESQEAQQAGEGNPVLPRNSILPLVHELNREE